MNRINFIKTVPLSKQREVRVWIWLCIISICAFVSSIIITSGIQWHLYRSLHQQKKNLIEQVAQFATIMSEQRKQLEEQQYLQKKLDTINRYKTNPKNPHPILAILRKAMHDLSLQSASITTKQFECNALCSSATQASASIKRLHQESSLHNIQLVSLQTQQDKIQISIKGNITTKLRDQT